MRSEVNQRVDTIFHDNLLVPGLIGANEKHKNLSVFLRQLVIDFQNTKEDTNEKLLKNERDLDKEVNRINNILLN